MYFSTLLAVVRVALLRSSWRSCFMRAALFIMRATNSYLVFTFFFVDFDFRPSPQTKIKRSKVCRCQLQTALSLHPLKIGHIFIWTYLLETVHTTTSQNIYYFSWNTPYISPFRNLGSGGEEGVATISEILSFQEGFWRFDSSLKYSGTWQ
jgi:hypothetical protein